MDSDDKEFEPAACIASRLDNSNGDDDLVGIPPMK